MVYGLDKLPWGRGRGFRRRSGFESVSRRGEHGRARSQVKGIRFVPGAELFRLLTPETHIGNFSRATLVASVIDYIAPRQALLETWLDLLYSPTSLKL